MASWNFERAVALVIASRFFAGEGKHEFWDMVRTRLMLELAKRAAPKKILACFVHPGGIYDTGMTTHLKEKEFKGPKEVSTANMGKSFDVDPPKTLSWGTAPILVASLNPGL
ncbi:MAG: hypothetical protein MMC23_004198 [Stictis urceolatum]|nr:hypothetical protein [Stictis urceolata]